MANSGHFLFIFLCNKKLFVNLNGTAVSYNIGCLDSFSSSFSPLSKYDGDNLKFLYSLTKKIARSKIYKILP